MSALVRQSKPIRRDGTWLFSDGTPIPDQSKADADPSWRDRAERLHQLAQLSGNAEPADLTSLLDSTDTNNRGITS